MRFLFNLITSIIIAPFKFVKFIVVDVIAVGIIGGIFSMVRSIVRTVFRPFSLLLLAGIAAAFYFASEEQKKKVRALIGM
jgi:hypothetical protein